MKNKKIQSSYIYQGFGFPIVLTDVPMIEIRGIWTPDIDYNALQNVALLALCHLSSPLTGNHLQFIRKCYSMTLEQFGEKFGVTHAAVLKWEKKKDKCPNISLNTEREIRLFILDSILVGAKEFRNAYRKIIEQKFIVFNPEPLQVNVQKDLAKLAI